MPKDWGSPHRCYFANTYFFMKLSGEGDMTGYRSPGPRPAPVFRSAICDCLSLNVSISLRSPALGHETYLSLGKQPTEHSLDVIRGKRESTRERWR